MFLLTHILMLLKLKPLKNHDMFTEGSSMYISVNVALFHLTSLDHSVAKPPHQAANQIRLTGTTNRIQHCRLNFHWTSHWQDSFSACLCILPSSLSSSRHQKGEDNSKQRLPVVAGARKTQRYHPRLRDQILRKGWCRMYKCYSFTSGAFEQHGMINCASETERKMCISL